MRRCCARQLPPATGRDAQPMTINYPQMGDYRITRITLFQ